jgi:hypothetical protein
MTLERLIVAVRVNNRRLVRVRKAHIAGQRLQKKWDQILSNQGVSMNRGLSDKLSYVGTGFNLVILEKLQKGQSVIK